MSRLILLVLICLPIVGPLWAGPRVFQVQPGFQGLRMAAHAEYIRDQNGNLNLEGVRKIPEGDWKPMGGENLNLGYNIKTPVWIRFRLRNNSENTQHLFLQEPYPALDQIGFYILTGTGPVYRHWKLGGAVSFGERLIPHQTFVVPLSLPPGQIISVYIRVKTEGVAQFNPGLYTGAGLLRQILYTDPVLWVYMGFLLLMFVYNLLLFLALREPAYLYYVLFVFSLIVSRVLVNGLGYLFDSPGLTPFTRGLTIFVIMGGVSAIFQFFRAYIDINKYSPRLDKLVKMTAILYLGIACVYPFLSEFWDMAMYVIMFASLFSVFILIYLALKKSREAILATLAFAAFLLGTLVLSLQLLGVLPSHFLTLNAVRIGSSIQVVLLSLALADKIKQSRTGAQKSEAGYRHLMVNSRNIVFTLDQDFTFLSVGPVIYDYLGLKEEEVLGTNFVDLLFPETLTASIGTRDSFEENLRHLVDSDNHERLRFFIRSRHSLEPRPMRLRLEYIQGEEESLMLGELSPVTEDTLKASIQVESQVYIIGNSVNDVEILSHRLTSILPRFVEPDDVFALRLCLREALLNAIEHGNLELKYSEKAQILGEGRYFELLKTLQADPRFKERKVQVEYRLERDQVSFRITDEGPGFNHKTMLLEVKERAREEMNPNGRGLLMIVSEFDRVEFNQKGNSIFMVRFFKGRENLASPS